MTLHRNPLKHFMNFLHYYVLLWASPNNMCMCVYIHIYVLTHVYVHKDTYCIFQIIRWTFPPQIWEENGGAPYSLNVAYLAHWGGVTGVVAVERGHRRQEQDHIFCFNFFPYFPPLKPRCVLWSGAPYSLKNMVLSVATRLVSNPRSH